eukprot:284241-Rhodomonas_salina.1
MRFFSFRPLGVRFVVIVIRLGVTYENRVAIGVVIVILIVLFSDLSTVVDHEGLLPSLARPLTPAPLHGPSSCRTHAGALLAISFAAGVVFRQQAGAVGCGHHLPLCCQQQQIRDRDGGNLARTNVGWHPTREFFSALALA